MGVTLMAVKPRAQDRVTNIDAPGTRKVHRALVRRSLTASNLANVQLYFDVAVLDRYLGVSGFSLVRTDTVGRLRRQGGWSLDFGIAPGEELIHSCAGDLTSLPEEERVHWASFAASLPASKAFLQTRLSRNSCFEDGQFRNW